MSKYWGDSGKWPKESIVKPSPNRNYFSNDTSFILTVDICYLVTKFNGFLEKSWVMDLAPIFLSVVHFMNSKKVKHDGGLH